jgi:hypothetical protein
VNIANNIYVSSTGEWILFRAVQSPIDYRRLKSAELVSDEKDATVNEQCMKLMLGPCKQSTITPNLLTAKENKGRGLEYF